MQPFEMHRRRLLYTGSLLGGSVLGLSIAPKKANSQEPGILGQLAPELSSEFWIDGKGQPTQFSVLAQKGKWVHLKFWQSWCPGCHAHGFPSLVRIAQAFENEPRVVNAALQTVFEGFGVNSADRVRQTQLRYKLPILFGHDPNNSRANPRGTMAKYRSGGTPWHVLIAPDSRVVFNGFNLNPDTAINFLKQQLAKAKQHQ